ncbi:hypothetical protein OsJ_34728 [Oryza sativa Japonica Group]|uniref:Uncharacterized protein n=1 Tax=Oryza sativa subsp. japonica TaxID=39947 RepID=B9G8Q3_ORYSJ|nr:hypothetical protein OsJ_34728 [Oryza sativa Japonica Group]
MCSSSAVRTTIAPRAPPYREKSPRLPSIVAPLPHRRAGAHHRHRRPSLSTLPPLRLRPPSFSADAVPPPFLLPPTYYRCRHPSQ